MVVENCCNSSVYYMYNYNSDDFYYLWSCLFKTRLKDFRAMNGSAQNPYKS